MEKVSDEQYQAGCGIEKETSHEFRPKRQEL
jgi:hypothetical protein